MRLEEKIWNTHWKIELVKCLEITNLKPGYQKTHGSENNPREIDPKLLVKKVEKV